MIRSGLSLFKRFSGRLLVPAVLFVGGGLTTVLFFIQHHFETSQAVKVFRSEAETVVTSLHDTLRRSAALPQTSAALVNVLPRLDGARWRAFVNDLRPFESMPGLAGYGVAERVEDDALDAFSERMVREGEGNVRVFPRIGPGPYWPVLYGEPESVAKFIRGFNLGSDPTRRKAMEFAGDHGDSGMTGLVSLGFLEGDQKPTGFLIFHPVYSGDRRPTTPEERRAALKGFTLAIFRVDGMIDAIAGSGRENRVLSLYDMEAATPQLAHRSSRSAEVGDDDFRERVSFTFGGHAWRLDIAATQGYVARVDRQRSMILLLGGVLGTLAAAVILHVLVNARQRADVLARQMTDELRGSEERFRSLTSLSSDWYWEQDANFRYTYLSPGFATNSFDPATMIGRCRWELPIDLAPAQWAVHRATLEAHRPFRDFEYRVRSEDGRWHWFRVSGEPLFDAAGIFAGYRGTGRDITPRKEAEHRLALMNYALDHVHEAAFLMRTGTQDIVYVNKEASRSLGYSREELLTKTIFDFDPRISPAELDGIHAALAEHGHVTFETVHRSKLGREFPVEINATLLEFEGEKHGLSLARDISERKAQEAELKRHRDNLKEMVEEQTAGLLAAKNEAERASQAKSEFLANMSHELRTPMHAILSFARLGHERVGQLSKEKLTGYFDRIIDSGGRLLGLIDNLLDLAKIEAGKMPLNRRKVELSALTADVVRDLEPLLATHHLQYTENIAAEVRSVRVDGTRVAQVLRNLLANAIRFSPDGGTIELAAEAATIRGRRAGDTDTLPAVCLAVADRGVGIPEEELEIIFEKFQQSSATRDGSGGTGLGLSICREIVRAHGGSISARNRAGGGAEFVVLLPNV